MRCTSLLLTLTLVACGSRVDFTDKDGDTGTPNPDGDADTDTDTDADSDADSDTDTDTDTDVDEDCDNGRDDDADGDSDCDDSDCASDAACAECWDEDVAGSLGAEIASGTASGNDGSGSCGGGSTADTFVTWTAPATDTYVFDTVGSATDTLLWVAADECDGAELACNDDTFDENAQVTLSLTRGDVLVFGVEASGSWVLNAWQGDCPAYSIGSELAITGSTTGMSSDYAATCREVTNAITLRWIAPSSGTWTFSTAGSDFDTVLALFEDTCDGDELGCSDDGETDTTSEVSVYLAAGDVVAIVLGGYGGDAGSYDLTID